MRLEQLPRDFRHQRTQDRITTPCECNWRVFMGCTTSLGEWPIAASFFDLSYGLYSRKLIS